MADDEERLYKQFIDSGGVCEFCAGYHDTFGNFTKQDLICMMKKAREGYAKKSELLEKVRERIAMYKDKKNNDNPDNMNEAIIFELKVMENLLEG